MKNPIRTAVLYGSALALTVGAGLSACSKEGGTEGTEATEATEEGSQGAGAAEGDMDSETSKNAQALLKKMSDYMASQDSFSLAFDSIFEVVSEDHQKLEIATSGTIAVDRPDKIHTTRKSGFSDTEMVFDGKTLSFLGKGQNAYIQTEAPGTIDQLIDQLRDKFHRQLPGADLLQGNIYESLMEDVTDAKDLGSGIIGGVECDHLAFRSADTDWQIWIAQGDKPYPCRYVITSTGVDQAPQFTLEVREFTPGGSGSFTFTPPAGARKMEIGDLENLRETADLPENYRVNSSE